MKQAIVSIIVPVYNAEKYLKKCVDSILSQTFRNFELILVDDGSTDNSLNLCNNYKKKDHRIEVVHKKNGGPCSARNFGLEIAKGKYIYFVDSDDYIERKLLEKTIKIMDAQKGDWCCFGMVKEDVEGKLLENIAFKPLSMDIKNETDRMRFLLKYLLNYRTGWEQCNHIFCGDIIREHHLRFSEERIVLGEDLLFAISYWLYAKKCIVIEDLLYHYVQHEDSLMWHSKHRNVLPEIQRLAKNAYDAVVKSGNEKIRNDFILIYYHLLEWHARPYVADYGAEWVKNEINKLDFPPYLEKDFFENPEIYRNMLEKYGREDGFITVIIVIPSKSEIPTALENIKKYLNQTLQKLDLLVLSYEEQNIPFEDIRLRQIVISNLEKETIIRMIFEESYGEYIYISENQSEVENDFLERVSDALKYNDCSTVIVDEKKKGFINSDSLHDRAEFRNYIRNEKVKYGNAMFRADLLERSGLSCMWNLEEYFTEILLSGHIILI